MHAVAFSGQPLRFPSVPLSFGLLSAGVIGYHTRMRTITLQDPARDADTLLDREPQPQPAGAFLGSPCWGSAV
jgi:hypothetical protein